MVPICGDAITEALALKDRLEAKMAKAVGDFDAASLWELDAATSMTAMAAPAGHDQPGAARKAM